MKILLSNDDGISSAAMYMLAKELVALGTVYVIAPDREQSAISHAITMHKPLRCTKTQYFDTQIEAWAVNGTPADCIKLGIESILTEKPDLVVSGINKGENVGSDVLYSGTVSAALEGTIFGITSFAFSYEDGQEKDFTVAAKLAMVSLKEILAQKIDLNCGRLFNINIPKCNSIDEIKGTMITKLGVKTYKNNFEEREDPRGNKYYWLAGELVQHKSKEDTDVYAIKNKYISITPMQSDLTDFSYINTASEWKLDIRR